MQPSSSISPFSNALANAKMHFDLAAITPSSPNVSSTAFSKETILSGWGNVCVKPSIPVSTGVPQALAIRPTNTLAAFTVICCPKMAHTAVSKASKHPGTRSPEAHTPGLIPFSACKVSYTISESQYKSNKRFTRVKTCESTGTKVSLNVTQIVCFFGLSSTEIQPLHHASFLSGRCTVLIYFLLVIFSTPEIAR